MISQATSSLVRNAYTASVGDTKDAAKASTNITKQGDMSKIEKIKESLESGEYKVDLQALSERIADELL